MRHDIQGLRAVAVVLVIANHLWGWPGGGFVGVDVFFVISGFLITGLLLREHERSGRISMLGFYQRRVKRILPAALTVTLVTVVVGYAAFTKARFDGLVADAFWATLFSANWRAVFLGTDYMHADDAISPLQHFWSLSIEEQFYFVWPFVLVIALTYGASRPRRVAGTVIAIIGVTSFVFALWETVTHPTSAYFSTFSRAWELAAGAFLALGAARLGQIPDRVRPVVAWFGLVVILGSAALMTDQTPFPGPFALFPVLGAVAVIAAGLGGPVRYFWPMTNRVSGYVGNLSYSLYLWHFPVIIFSTLFLAEAPRRLTVVVLVLTVLLSMASYHFIENPIRYQSGAKRMLRPVATLAVIAVVAATAVTVAPRPTSSQAAEPDAVNVRVVREDFGPKTETQWKAIDAALAQKEWPELQPAVDAMGAEDKAPEWIEDGCLANERGALSDPIENAMRCNYGPEDAEKVAVVYGDSIAISWVPGLRAALVPEGYRIEVLTSQQCPTAAVGTFFNDGSEMTDCAPFREWALAHIDETQPDLVIASNVPSTLDRLTSGSEGDAAVTEWEQGQRETLTSLADAAASVVVLRAPPGRNGSEACQTKGNTPADCLLHKSSDYQSMHDADVRVAAEAGVKYIDTAQWFCDPSGDCPAFTGTMPVLADGSHLSGDYSASLAGVIREAILRR